MRSVTRSSSRSALQLARTDWHHPLLPFACARWLELRSLAERSRAIAQSGSPRTERCRPVPNFHKLHMAVSVSRGRPGTAVLALLWAASLSLVAVVAVIALYAMSIEVINR